VAILDMAAANEALKKFYLPALRYQYNEQADPLLTQLERDSEHVEGEKIVMALRYGRSGGAGFRSDSDDLPTPNSRKTKKAEWETKNMFARMQISDKVIEAARTSVGAFANLLEQEMEDLMEDAKDLLSMAVYGDGTGKIAVITAASWAANVLTLTVGADYIRFFSEGRLYDVIDASATPDAVLANGSRLECISVDETNNQIKLTSTTDISPSIEANADYLVHSGDLNMEVTGLDAVFAQSGNIYGLDRATYPFLKAITIAINGTLGELDIQMGIDRAETRAGAETNFLIGSMGVRRSYQMVISAQKQLVNSLELKGGWSALAYRGGKGDIPIIGAKYAPAQKLRGLDTRNWKVYEIGDWNWMEKDGAILSRVSGKPVYEATLRKYCDLGCDKIRGQWELTGLTEV